jgi:hypothetical protein
MENLFNKLNQHFHIFKQCLGDIIKTKPQLEKNKENG